jgi:hypothetical protein
MKSQIFEIFPAHGNLILYIVQFYILAALVEEVL